MLTVRTAIFVDSLQPQITGFMGATGRGYLPRTYDASYWIEVAPGIAVNRLTDVAIKATRVAPAVQVVERAYGLLEVHHPEQGEVLAARDALLAAVGAGEDARLKPRVLTSERITGIDDYQCMLINRDRQRRGMMITARETLYVLECHPAGYAAYACNEAEKAAEVQVLWVQPYGAFGRLQLCGTDAHMAAAQAAVEAALAAVAGRPNEGRLET